MKKKLCAILACVSLLIGGNAHADSLSMSTTTEATLIIDTNVRVINYVDGEEVELYTGPISQFENGMYAGTDFTGKDFLVVLEWGDELNLLYYIYPLMENSENDNIINNSEQINISDTINVNKEINLTSTGNDPIFIEYDINYDIISGEESFIDIEYSVHNSDDEEKSVSLIAALYDSERLCDVKIDELNIGAENEQTDNLTLSLPDDRDDCYVKMVVWDDIGTLRPVGSPKYVNDLDEYNHEKYLYITLNSNSEFNLFMNSSSVKGSNQGAIHTIKYNCDKITPIDLYGFTYQKELNEGEVSGTETIINKADLENGEVQYNFGLPEGRNTGVNNYIKFKANTELNNELIVYTIQ